MTNRTTGLLRFRRPISICLCMTFLLYSLFVINCRIIVGTPALGVGRMFIGEAKPYFFEKSSAAEKDLEYENSGYKNLWLSLPSVTKVVTTDELESYEFWETPYIWSVTINGQEIGTSPHRRTEAQEQIYEETLNQLSAAAWKRVLNNLIRSLVIWFCITALLISWIIYLDKTTGVLF